MKFKKGDRVRHKTKASEWFVQRTTDASRVYCTRHTTKKGEDETVCFLREDLELIRKEHGGEIVP